MAPPPPHPHPKAQNLFASQFPAMSTGQRTDGGKRKEHHHHHDGKKFSFSSLLQVWFQIHSKKASSLSFLQLWAPVSIN